jgi:indolepyruvate ferredoxin oxidoreductase
MNASAGSEALTDALARNLFKLMAYKDEYEVARLHLIGRDAVRSEVGAGSRARISWYLHPPFMRALGVKHKVRVGYGFRHAFRLLRAMKRLRGTPADVFGYAHVRRVERSLVAEYEQAISRALAALTAANLPTAVELAELPDIVRGYESVKLASIEDYRKRLAETQARLERPRQALPSR